MFYSNIVRRAGAAVVVAAISAAVITTSLPACAESLGRTDPDKAGFFPQRLARITAYFNNEVATGKIPGAVVLIQRHGQPAYYESFGVRSPATKAPMTPDTIFTLFSMTKPITSVAALMLVEQGKLALDDEVGQYVKGFYHIKVGVEKPGPDGKPELDLVAPRRPIQIHDLLRHSAGIPYASLAYGVVKKPYEDADLMSGKFTNAEVADKIAALPLISQPGEYWTYGHATDVLGRVIEVVSGKSLYQFEKENLLGLLGMTNTSFFVTDPAKQALIADPFQTKYDKLDRDPREVTKWESGGGGMVSSIADYARFVQMLLNGGELNGTRILARKTVDLMTSNHIGEGTGIKPWVYYFPGAGFGFGLGVAVRTDAGVSHWPGSVGEFEWSGGSGTYFLADPKENMFAILMIQSPSQRGRIQSAFRSLVYGAMK
ncbi:MULTISPECIES: serine hydrolase domain-containing protein [unclassified Afipia]|uniref:serine hydrolase domain-containing protein n=1 Tax=unclassified Afipia TaxID=2642050 RepID=UPI000464D8B2|nr:MULTISPECIES: serine hydrolase domain-containing protein [unclassified Afipia]MAH68046.1 serine hydrolase [Afipia sp.]OUX62887.1 MAG: serine hydrolase [Afipia sp. TMED4]HAO43859.1 serine hydrolase [Afipia sp.]HAP11945.1 serine hydrolase [Afipia sp.]HAP45994.1 serine hydrolase [Afipia sp.]